MTQNRIRYKLVADCSVDELIHEAVRRDDLSAITTMAEAVVRRAAVEDNRSATIVQDTELLASRFGNEVSALATNVAEVTNPDEALKTLLGVAEMDGVRQDPQNMGTAVQTARRLKHGSLTLMRMPDPIRDGDMPVEPSNALTRLAEYADCWRSLPRMRSEGYDLEKNRSLAMRLEAASQTIRTFLDSKDDELDAACGFEKAQAPSGP